jgi:tape measure domain-containing protein
MQVNGAAKFKQDFKDASQAVKSASAELKYFSNELTRTGASEDALKNKISSLNNAFQAEQNAIDMLQDRIAKLSQETGEGAVVETQKWTAELYKHKDAQAQIQSELASTENELRDFSSGADKATNEVDELGDKAEEAGSQIGDSFATDVAKATVFFDKLANAAIAVGKEIWKIGKDAVEYNAQMESYSRTIEAFFKTSGQGAEEATQNTADLIANQKALSAQIGIGADKLIDANKMLIASGVNGNKSQQAVSALAKAIVATGGGNEELSRMAQNLQQISNTGKASTQDMKQFAAAGVDVYGLLADSTGKTVEELKEMDITFDMIVDALDNATQEGGKFYEASQVGASTLNGQMGLLQSTIRDGLGTAFEPVNAKLRDEVIPKMLEISEGIDWNAVGELIADAAEVAATAFGILAETIDTAAQAYQTIKGAIEDWGGAWDRATSDARNGYLGMAGAFKKAYDDENKLIANANTVATSSDKAVTSASGSFAKLPKGISIQEGSVKQASQSLANSATTPLTSLNTYQWGSDAGNGFASGLRSTASTIFNAAFGIAGAIASVLHFSRPDVGPLHDYETWMPHFVEGLADTMRASEWRLAQASEELASTVTNNTTNNISMNVYGTVGQDPKQIANEVMVRIQQATNKRQAVWA